MTKILIIDDDDLTRGMIAGAMKKIGYETFTASNGNEGVEMAKTNNPDIVLTDMLMPDKEGIETIIEIRSINPAVKIIAMSGGGSTKNMTFLEMAKKVGAAHTLTKPFKPSDLIDAINAVKNS